MAERWLVVSDVDHTLLEHPSEIPITANCLRQLRQRGINTWLASSKTFTEMVELQSQLGLPAQPFLFENGCGIGWPHKRWPPHTTLAEPARVLGDYGAIVRGEPPAPLQARLKRLRDTTGWRFSLLEELPFSAIKALIGLDEHLARQALERLASVPLVWNGDDSEFVRLQQHLAREGICAVQGGHLVHVAAPFHKGEALAHLLAMRGSGSGPLRVLACGDSENDRTLLERADLALVFHPPDRQPMVLGHQAKNPAIPVCSTGGPIRWLEAVEAALAIGDQNMYYPDR
jgi:mannosyl-3-phosphoglycerate phosphatase family protein